MSAEAGNDPTIWGRAKYAAQCSWQGLDRWVDARISANRDSRGSIDFKPDAQAIEDAPVPISAHAALYTVLLLLVVAITWAIFGSVDRIVVAPGKITTRSQVIVLQPFTTSRILHIDVKPGDHVRKGQILTTFDPAFAQADVAALNHKVTSRSAEIERIDAQLSGRSFTAKAEDDPERITQAQIYRQEMSTYDGEMSQRDSRRSAIEAMLRADEAGIVDLRRQVEMAQKVVDIQKYLDSEKAGAALDVIRAQTSLLDIDLRLKNTTGDLRKLNDQRQELDAERKSFFDKWHSDHNQQLVQARQDLAEATETLNKARRMKDLTNLTAPEDGVILEVADRSVGSVLREAETLLTLVPDGADLYIEAKVASRDVSYLKVGDLVRIKLETYPFQRYGTLNGRLDVIGADSVPLKEDDQTQFVFRAQVRLTDKLQDLVRRGIQLRPGMVASAEIKTGKRSIAAYILNPILRTSDESLREP